MTKRKFKVLDKSFQLKTTFSVMGMFALIIGLMIAVIGINLLNDNRKLNIIIGNQENTILSQREIIDSILKNKIADDPAHNSKLEAALKDYDKNIESLKNNMLVLKEITLRNNNILLIMVVFLVGVGFILYKIIIRQTHKVSGPIYIMSKYIHDIIDGKYPDLRPLRKNDELKDFYELFGRLIDVIREKKKGEIGNT